MQENEIINGKVYLVTNQITGEMYVGQTIKSLKERWYGHTNSRGFCRALSNAMKKYGPGSFFIDQIDSASSFKELNMKEVYWIQVLNTLAPNGYNIKTGGTNKRLSKEVIKKISESKKRYHENKKFLLLTNPDGCKPKTHRITKGTLITKPFKIKSKDSYGKRLGIPHTAETKLKISAIVKKAKQDKARERKLALLKQTEIIPCKLIKGGIAIQLTIDL